MEIKILKDFISEILVALESITYNSINRLELMDTSLFIEINGELSNNEKETLSEKLRDFNIKFLANIYLNRTQFFVEEK